LCHKCCILGEAPEALEVLGIMVLWVLVLFFHVWFLFFCFLWFCCEDVRKTVINLSIWANGSGDLCHNVALLRPTKQW
jgi:hypothetical protein